MPEWSRSRFWFAHFLYSRHERPKLRFDGGPAAGNASDGLRDWLRHGLSGACVGGASMVRNALQRHADDPAFVQTIRLLAKERDYHAGLVAQLAARWRADDGMVSTQRSETSHALLPAGTLSLPGVRFELSLILLSGLVNAVMLRGVSAWTNDPLTRDALHAIADDLAQHGAFCVERLTAEFADFNFARRNLRRWRLRSMFAGVLARHAWRHRGLLREMGLSVAGFCRATWPVFESALERMVPYHREALIAALLRQREQPYDDALGV